jgi:hypothetical protein
LDGFKPVIHRLVADLPASVVAPAPNGLVLASYGARPGPVELDLAEAAVQMGRNW